MANSILCTIDFSASSEHALRWAVTMAQQLNAPLTILYAYRLIPTQTDREAILLKKKTEAEARQKFAILESEVLQGKGVVYVFRIEIGFVSDRIEDHARRNTLSFLVMDKKMSTDSTETFEELVEHIHVPLLLVP